MANKIDQSHPKEKSPTSRQQAWGPEVTVPVSALTGQNLPQLRTAIDNMLHGRQRVSANQEGIALTARQRRALQGGLTAVTQALELVTAEESPELVALELRTALDELGAISGEVVADDVLDLIFGQFCVGK